MAELQACVYGGRTVKGNKGVKAAKEASLGGKLLLN